MTIRPLNDLEIPANARTTFYYKSLQFHFFAARELRTQRPIVVVVRLTEKFLVLYLQTCLDKECLPLLRRTGPSMRGIAPFFNGIVEAIKLGIAGSHTIDQQVDPSHF